MISIKVTIAPESPKQILVELQGKLTNPRALNAALAERLSDELQTHFRRKNAQPNKRGWTKTNFWNQIANTTSVASVSDAGAIVTVAEERFRIHVTGGTIFPGPGKKALTIPLIQEARGLMASSYAQKFNRLFTIPGRHALFERTDRGTESVINKTSVRSRTGKRTLTLPLAARSTVRPVYALVASAKIPMDPDALPSAGAIQDALLDEASTYFEVLA
jgi:hypothetical protein